MSIFSPTGLAAYTLFGLCGELVMATLTVFVLRRGHPALVHD